MPSLAKTLVWLALLLVPVLGHAAEVLPTAGRAVGVVRDDTPGSWAVVSQYFASVDVKEIEGDAAKGYLGCFFEGQAGKYLVIKSGGGKLKTFAVTLGGVAPAPPGPGPIVDPPVNPPVDPPQVGKLRVLFLEESANRPIYTRDQLAVLTSSRIREYLTAHCENSSASVPEWRFWDDDFTAAGLTGGGYAEWVRTYDAAVKASGANTANAKEPWLLVEIKGKVVVSQQVNGGEEATLELLKKYGGQ